MTFPPGLKHFDGPKAIAGTAGARQLAMLEEPRMGRMFQDTSAFPQPFDAQRAEFLFAGQRLGLMGAIGGPRPARWMNHHWHAAIKRSHVPLNIEAFHGWQGLVNGIPLRAKNGDGAQRIHLAARSVLVFAW